MNRKVRVGSIPTRGTHRKFSIMKFLAKMTEVTKVEADIVVVFGWEGKDKELVLSEEAVQVDRALAGMLSDVAGIENFEGKPGNELHIHTHGKIPSSRVLLVGIGNPKELSVSDIQLVSARIGRAAKKVRAKRVALSLSKEMNTTFDVDKIAESIVCGMRLGTYTFIKHKSEESQKKEKEIEDVSLLVRAPKLNEAAKGIEHGLIVSDAVIYARDLVNESPSVTTPKYLGEVAKRLVKPNSHITADVFGVKEIESLGMGALLSIARGSSQEPRFIHLNYNGGNNKTVVLIGKGITFDTGGLSLKPSEHMESMKMDMSGAAVVLGVFSVLSVLKPKIHVIGLIPATENMPGPNAIKPGDVVTAMSGKTIEILNTDAEGRVVLADALSYAGKKVPKASSIIDLATLTGACMVALGEDIAGLFTNDAGLSADLKKSGLLSGEKLWELPLANEYKDKLKSTVADVKNISGTRYGGAINGALFLQEFVPEHTPWAHIDIAGPAFAEKDAPLAPHGATGYGVGLILGYLLSLK